MRGSQASGRDRRGRGERGVGAGGARVLSPHAHRLAGRQTGEGRGPPYQINERQELPAPAVGLMRGHFDGLVVAQDGAVGQQDRHPQHLAGDERHVRAGPEAARRRGGTRLARSARGGRGGSRAVGGTASARAACAGGAACAGTSGGRGRAGGVASAVPSPPSFSCVRGAPGDPEGGRRARRGWGARAGGGAPGPQTPPPAELRDPGGRAVGCAAQEGWWRRERGVQTAHRQLSSDFASFWTQLDF